jgi:hypothetical protein
MTSIIKRHPIYFFPTHILTIILLIKNRHGLFHVFRVHIGPILGESTFTPDQKHPLVIDVFSKNSESIL